MKNTILRLLILIGLLFTQSCKTTDADSKALMYGGLAKWDGNGCSGSGGSCLREVIIQEKRDFEIINSSFSRSEKVSSYFKGNEWKKNFKPVINLNLLKVLQSGEYSMYRLKDGNRNHYFLGKGKTPSKKFIENHLVIFHCLIEK